MSSSKFLWNNFHQSTNQLPISLSNIIRLIFTERMCVDLLIRGLFKVINKNTRKIILLKPSSWPEEEGIYCKYIVLYWCTMLCTILEYFHFMIFILLLHSTSKGEIVVFTPLHLCNNWI